MDYKKNINVWSLNMDENLLKTILLVEPYQHKSRTKESGYAWKLIAEQMNESNLIKMTVDARACRERFALLKTKRADVLKREERASGIAPTANECDKILDEILDRIEEFGDILSVEKDLEKLDAKHDRKVAEDIRLQALESYSATRKRKQEDDLDSSIESSSGSSTKKSKSSGGKETMILLREAAERKETMQKEEMSLKTQMLNFEKEKQKNIEEELKFRKEQLDIEREREERQNDFHTQLLRNMQDDRRQQQQNQQMMAMMHSLVNNIVKK